MSELHVYKIDTGASEWVIAESESDAIRLLSEWADIPAAEYDDAKCTMLPNDEVIGILLVDEGETITKTCAEWVAHSGEGFLASTEY